MIELQHDGLVFSFPEVHRDAVLRVTFQRTLRIPDDDREYPLPPGLGAFPLRHVDDFAPRVDEAWLRRGGVMLPMYQSEAMWLNFQAPNGYPFAVKVATGKINAATGEAWDEGLHRHPQDYLAIPEQPWLDGYCVERGVIRQFVAMPLGGGYSAEEQLTGKAEHGGLQLMVHPVRAEVYEAILRERESERASRRSGVVLECAMPAMADMGLAPGGRMRQEIYEDHRPLESWDTRHRARCFVHLANALVWRSITGENPPQVPPTADEYNRAGLPWFEYYAADRAALEGAGRLAGMKSVARIGAETGQAPLPENTSVQPKTVVRLGGGRREGEVREGVF
jgi:hypothetical protein